MCGGPAGETKDDGARDGMAGGIEETIGRKRGVLF